MEKNAEGVSAPDTDSVLLGRLLAEVSRSFYLTLRVLPKPVRAQIGLAYLLARATDTVADTNAVPEPERIETLRRMQRRIAGTSADPLPLNKFQTSHCRESERVLLERFEEAIRLLENFDPDDRAKIRTVLGTITEGQWLDLERFSGGSAVRIAALESDDQLEDYTYRVAGCVGEFWTLICLARLYRAARLNQAQLIQDGISFGKGLQFVNVLRDLPRDLRSGRCYIPRVRLAEIGLEPGDLLRSENEARFRPLYDEYLRHARELLAAGWNYTNALPRGSIRVRLACAWPILIGVRTLDELKSRPVLNPETVIKVSRGEVKKIMVRSLWTYPFPGLWNRQFGAFQQKP
jgi:farnesyl-diphosphate farnesyltransferase